MLKALISFLVYSLVFLETVTRDIRLCIIIIIIFPSVFCSSLFDPHFCLNYAYLFFILREATPDYPRASSILCLCCTVPFYPSEDLPWMSLTHLSCASAARNYLYCHTGILINIVLLNLVLLTLFNTVVVCGRNKFLKNLSLGY